MKTEMKPESDKAVKHTSGPWTYRSVTGLIVTEKGNAHFIADVRRHKDEGREMAAEDIANARLIAAAPDLLAAVEWAIENCGSHKILVDALTLATKGTK